MIKTLLALTFFIIEFPLSGFAETAWEAKTSSSGEVRLAHKGIEVATVRPGLFENGWKYGNFKPGVASGNSVNALKGRILAPSGAIVDSTLIAQTIENGVHLEYTLVALSDIQANSLFVGMDLPVAKVAGQPFSVDGKKELVPFEFGEVSLWSGKAQEISIGIKGGAIKIRQDTPMTALVQDNRQWGPSLTLRMGDLSTRLWKKGQTLELAFSVTSEQGMSVVHDGPVTITAGKDWIPLDVELDIEPGSALDFSSMGLHDAPAGKNGHVIARSDGTFAFEKKPDTPARFYGVNLCFSAHYITHEQSDRLAERLARLGYNAVRVHHHESELIGRAGGGSMTIPEDRKPARTNSLTLFEAPSNEGDRYTARIRGYVYPPKTEDYVFWIASDDNSTLFLSPDDQPGTKKVIASVSGWTGSQQWDKYATQKSKQIRLEAGKKYFIEANHREGEQGDHLAVAWQTSESPREVIPGKHLSKFGAAEEGAIEWEIWPDQATANSTQPNPEKLDQLQYLLAALKKHGIYITTDLFVSRPVLASEIWDGATGNVGMDEFKMLVPVNEQAFENWKEFVRQFMGAPNPHTGMPLARDPAFSWLSMINEGNQGNFIGRLSERAQIDWKREWNTFLAERYGTAAGLEKSWGKDSGDPVNGTVNLFTGIYDDSPQGRDLSAFLALAEANMFARMKKFLREELKCQALLTNMNAWTNRVATQAARADYDYVDDHFYVDHPQFIDQPWNLPSRCSNSSPIAAGAPGGRSCSFTRLLDKPFTVSEYNYSGPGRFRGVGGILTGCMGALQGWGVIWRFTYSHSRDNLFKPSPISYFDLSTDPLNQAADRAAVCLYLRGDMRQAPHTIALALNADSLRSQKTTNKSLAPGWNALSWVTRVGSFLAQKDRKVPGDLVIPFGGEEISTDGETLKTDPYGGNAGNKLLARMREKGWLEENETNLDENTLKSETGEILINAPQDMLVLNTPRTAGGYAPEGRTIQTDAARITMNKTYGTVWVSSVDGQPIKTSKRLIITHLTDLQNSEARFGEQARQTLNAWGKLPHLVQDGQATIHLELEQAENAKVFELTTGGRRLGTIPAKATVGNLEIELSVRNEDGKARMIYEVAVE